MRALTSKDATFQDKLQPEEREFVTEVLRGISLPQAATNVGFTRSHGYSLIRRPEVAAAIHAACRDSLTGQLAPKALLKLDGLLNSNNERVVLDAAKTVIQHAYKDDDGGKGGKAKPLSEMSRDELTEAYERARQELANRSTKVIDSSDDAQGDAQTDAKPLDILD